MEAIVIIPTYNEKENIAQIIPLVLSHGLDVLIVDDNSPDGTAQIVKDLMRDNPHIHILEREGKLGLGTAYIAGFKKALELGAQYIFEMDADFSHDPKYLPPLLEATKTKNDLTLGSRYTKGGGTENWGIIRQIISRGGNVYTKLLLNLPVKDATGGFRCYKRQVLETIDLDSVKSNGYGFQIEMVYRTVQAGFKVGEIPIIFPDRRVGKSKMSKKIVSEALVNVLKLRLQQKI